MTEHIRDINYKEYSAQKCEIRKNTEKNINSLFEKNIISQAERDTLLNQYLCGEISFGADGLTEAEANNFSEETYNEIEQNFLHTTKSKNKSLYIIQAGDTPEKIAEKLGFSGADARNFATKIKAKAIKDGVYYSYGFQTGDMITLDGDYKQQIENLKQNGEYFDTDEEINADYVDTKHKTNENNPVRSNNKKIKNQANQIAEELKTGASAGNKALKDINSSNVVFVLIMYNQKTGRSLARDIINNGDSKNFKATKDNICWHLAKRAQELKVGGVYYGDYLKINNAKELQNWIERAQTKVYEAEKRNNPAIESPTINQIKVKKQRSSKDIQKDAQALANNLFEEIDGAGSDANVTKSLLKKITPENAAFVVSSYLNAKCTVTNLRIKRHKENSSHRSLAKDVSEEWGLSINDVKNSICKPLATQAKTIGLTGIYFGDYYKINDIDELDKWITKAAAKIRTAMTNNVNTTRETVDKNATSQEKINTPVYKEAGIVKISQEYSAKGNVISSTYTYKDGKVVKEYQDPKRGRVRELIRPGKSGTKTNTTKISEPIPIKISVPNDASAEEKAFAKALEDNKAKLMSLLGIDNDTYNKLAKLALAIAKHETDFGHGGEYSKSKYDLARVAPDTPLHDWSYGPTQIKFEMHKKDSWIANKFNKLGLTKGTQLYDMTNSAMATMVVLAQNERIIKNNPKYQKGMEAAKGNVITENGWEIKNGHAQKTGHTKSWVNTVTNEDALYYFWNGQGVEILDGTMEPEKNARVRDVRVQLERYEIKEDAKAREGAIQKSKNKKAVREFKPMENLGALGSVVFMPKMYSYSDLNSEEASNVLKASLAKNSKIDENSKKLLILAVEHGEIGFEFGLTTKEANSLTQKDADMLLSGVSKLKSKIKNVGFSDGVNSSEAASMRNNYLQTIRDAELSFKKQYLASKTPVLATSSIPSANLLETPMNNDMTYSAVSAARRGFAGGVHDKIKDGGVNTANTSQASVLLAKYAQKTAKRMNSAGMCMTGFRAAIREAGIDDSDLREGTPRASVGFFERHPEMFEEVRYVNIGGGKARQINSTDLPNLPAGYIAVWTPDRSKYPDEPGHISITNGNGQAYADEVDNMDWSVYHGNKNSGKGEHGTFRVFRLTSSWSVVNGKLVLKH